jgi:signal peptide peptidase SppA
MNNQYFKLLHAITNGIFAMPEHILGNYIDFAISVKSGKTNFSLLPNNKNLVHEGIAIDAHTFEMVKKDAVHPNGDVIVANSLRFANDKGTTMRSIELIDGDAFMCIDLSGTLLKNYTDCNYGMTDMAQWLNAGAKMPKIKGAILTIDSPGGMVDGVNTLQESILNFMASSKPVIAFVNDGMACSAAYYVGCACTEFWASKTTDVLGSIGVMFSMADYSEAYKKLGITVHTIYAPESGDKNAEFAAIKNGNYELVQKNILSPIAVKFKADVERNRAGKLKLKADGSNSPFTGKIYQATEAMKIGLIDKIGSYEQAFARLKTLAAKQITINSTTNSTRAEAFEAFEDIDLSAILNT